MLRRMVNDELVSTLRDYTRAVYEAHDRRRHWQSLSGEIAKILQSRVDELKHETDVALNLTQHSEHDARTVQLGFGAQPAWRDGEKMLVESGAALRISLALNGFVRFLFVPSHVDGTRQEDAEMLGEIDPLLGSAEEAVDKYLAKFLTRATQTHWSHVKTRHASF
jgi:hypothetical protein